MSKTIERALRRQTDPDGILPSIRLRPRQQEHESAYQGYRVLRDLTSVGALQLSRSVEPTGRPVTRIEALCVDPGTEPSLARFAATLAILAMSSQEGRTLISDERGSSVKEAAMWHWLASEGLAVVESAFTPRMDLLRGEPVFEGVAYAPPVTLRG